ncbi:hypothetical protein AB4564_10155 [Vibrio sp. 10N.222.51.E8]|uniref:hypothetical protein n=1 Tax=unclassified Vibrio TaxID=2614977 RepID=UPI0010BDD303|nr:hypothetical protein [Vibrio sp. F13]TKG32161.1 hypothetical protein FCV85_11135 [Vibrio sp. F13]
MDPFDVGRVKENLPTTHIEFGSESERRTFELENATGENSAYEGSGQFRVSDFSKLVFNE